ncbi:unnamed protein product, partial [Durusdinium trenchii]
MDMASGLPFSLPRYLEATERMRPVARQAHRIGKAAAACATSTAGERSPSLWARQVAAGLLAAAGVRGLARPGYRAQRQAGRCPGTVCCRSTSTATAVEVETVGLVNGRFPGQFAPTPRPDFLKRRLEVWDRLWQKAQEELQKKPKQPIKVTLPDGSVREATSFFTTPLEIAEGISKRLAADAVVALVEYDEPSDSSCAPCVAADGEEDDEEPDAQGQLWDLTRPLEGNCKLELIKFDDARGQDTFWHSSSHVLGAALEDAFGGHLTIGPAVEGGFYYDMYLGEQRLSDSNFEEIEKTVAELRQSKAPFQRMVISREEALELFANNPFKVDLIERKVTPGTMTTAYRCGDLVDLCRGPHLPSTDRVKAFKVTKNSSAYWLASADNDSLQRIYGVSFPSEKLLKAHLRRLEEAKERDHRRVGKQQGLFFFDAVVSPGSCFWTSYGARIYNRLQELMRAEYRARGFEEVITPNIFSAELFKRSGHYQNYREDMYGFEVEGQEWYLKPMNCPGHCVLFDSRPRSYRELPIRMADFGVLHRNELSGTLSGLTRVRRFQQDDAHIFCREDQIKSEVTAALAFVFNIYELFGFEFSLALSTRPKKAMGSVELWQRAEEQLQQALEETGKPWSLKKGDGAFYGPKIDIQLQDALGRGHQCGTIQLDFQLPLRFNLRYQSEKGAEESASSTDE